MKARDTRDPTRRARRLQAKLRGLKAFDTIDMSMDDVELIHRGLAALIDVYAKGSETRATLKRMQ